MSTIGLPLRVARGEGPRGMRTRVTVCLLHLGRALLVGPESQAGPDRPRIPADGVAATAVAAGSSARR